MHWSPYGLSADLRPRSGPERKDYDLMSRSICLSALGPSATLACEHRLAYIRSWDNSRFDTLKALR